MLRYSNESFFSSMIDWPRSYSCNDSKITVLDRFDQILGTMINDSVTQATGAHDEPGATKFATKEASLSSSIKLYCLVQCTPDISSYDCDKCLRGLIANIPFSCSGKQGAMALTPNCNFRCEAYQFYRNLAMPPPRSGLAPTVSCIFFFFALRMTGSSRKYPFILVCIHYFILISIIDAGMFIFLKYPYFDTRYETERKS